jgi:hypothetical protein
VAASLPPSTCQSLSEFDRVSSQIFETSNPTRITINKRPAMLTRPGERKRTRSAKQPFNSLLLARSPAVGRQNTAAFDPTVRSAWLLEQREFETSVSFALLLCESAGKISD